MTTRPNVDDALRIAAVPFDSPAVARLLATWDDELRARIPGFSPRSGSTVEAEDFRLPAGVFLLATRDGRDLGCGGLRRLEDRGHPDPDHPGARIAEVKRLFVVSPTRGTGVGRALLLALEERARSLGYTTIRLDTHGGDHPAVGLFRASGYRAIADYNGNRYAQYWFEKRLA